MGCDIHWMIERQDIHGTWHTVMSDTYAAYRHFGKSIYASPDFMDLIQHPIMRIGDRNYSLFGALSRVRCDEDDGPTIASSNLPDDASQHAADFFLDNDDLHSHGHFTLAHLRDCITNAPDDIFEDIPDGLEAAQQFLNKLTQALVDPAVTETILVGSIYAEDDVEREYPFAPMDSISSHEKLRLMRLSHDLKPVGDDSIRILIAYDN